MSRGPIMTCTLHCQPITNSPWSSMPVAACQVLAARGDYPTTPSPQGGHACPGFKPPNDRMYIYAGEPEYELEGGCHWQHPAAAPSGARPSRVRTGPATLSSSACPPCAEAGSNLGARHLFATPQHQARQDRRGRWRGLIRVGVGPRPYRIG